MQVLEYYRKYSQNSNLDQYFSLPTTSASSESVKYYYSLYELNPKLGDNSQSHRDFNLKSYVPKERRRWVRPPLVGQSSVNDGSGMYVHPLANPQSPSPEPKRATPETIPEEKSECQDTPPDVTERKAPSPTSSVASYKPLEWDSGADVGYFASMPHSKPDNKQLSTIERMALARGCSAALRLDPEGTTESRKLQMRRISCKTTMKPDANSTAITQNISGSESEVEITPIVKNHLPGVITGDDIKSEERKNSRDSNQQNLISQSSNVTESIFETPKSSNPPVFKVPQGSTVKYGTENRRSKATNLIACTSPLKKSSSMNILAMPVTKVPLKRSQSDLNLHARDKSKVLPRLIFNSTSSIATVVSKPTTCDKVIQTTLNFCNQESVGVQVSVLEEEKPPLPKRGTSLNQRSLHSILKNPKYTYKVQSKRNDASQGGSKSNTEEQSEGTETRRNSSETSASSSSLLTPQFDETENITGRANSFEYFPGHIYENVPNGSASQVSSVNTGRSNSTMPNTSSSIEEKLWGESDNLVQDLERSVNILKSLVDANKCDKEVKKRLIHHVVKRLVTAKYTDDKIEHNLEENVPWNPDDARKKVYRAEIIKALAKKQNTTDSSDDWKPQKKKSGTSKKSGDSVTRAIKEIINLGSSNSDKFDRNTDRTEMDGRKARMGLRTDDCDHSSNTPTDPNKSESSECFMPQRNYKPNKMKNIFCLKQKCEVPHQESTTTNSSPADQNRVLLDAVVNNRRSPDDSSNHGINSPDWRLPTTISERQFELRRCSNSDSGDTKLVSYAEMEKQNQLIWITNEISHLSNLKKLLEQPKKLDRAKTFPKKSKQPLYKQSSLINCMQEQSTNPESKKINTSDMTDNSLNEQWSSHCNLASCHKIDNPIVKSLKPSRKKNSFTQTATDNTDALSKTGGEIVSTLSRLQNTPAKLTNICVQTLPQQTSATSNHTHNPVGQGVCPLHQSYMHHQKYRSSEQTFQCQRHCPQNSQQTCVHHPTIQSLQNSPKSCHQNAQQLHRKEDRPIITISTTPSPTNDICTDFARLSFDQGSTDDNLKQKDAKNHANATKSRFTCDCESNAQVDQNCRCELKLEEGKAEKCKKLLSRICELCSRQIERIDANSPLCYCDRCKYSNYCTCENKEGNARNSRKSTSSEKSEVAFRQGIYENGHVFSCTICAKSEKFCSCSDDCNCEFKVTAQTKRSCEHCGEKNIKRDPIQNGCAARSNLSPRKEQTRPYYLTNSHERSSFRQAKEKNNFKCKCDKDCVCSNKLKDTEERLNGQKCDRRKEYKSGEELKSPEKSCKCCRTCGTTYQKNRKCECRISYPKPVAYELSFVEDKEKESPSKLENVEVKALGKVSSSNSLPLTARSGTCSCEDMKLQKPTKKKEKKNTLQVRVEIPFSIYFFLYQKFYLTARQLSSLLYFEK